MYSKFYKIGFLGLLAAIHWSCAGVRTIDSRPLLSQPENLKKTGYPLPAPSVPQTVYVRQSQIDIKEVDQRNRTGSLFNLEDQKNDLYGNLNPDGVGRFIEVVINLPRSKDRKENRGKENDVNKRTPEEEELLKQFPELVPPEEEYLRVQHFFKMQIMQKFPNGDVLAFYKRSSDALDENRTVSVSARIPFGDLVKTSGVTTDDLSDIHFTQVAPNDTVDRRSSNWEDEYSLRISRFHESRSREASELARKRKELNQFRQRMLDRIKTFGSERLRTAKERDRLIEEKKKDVETIDKLKSKVDEQEKQLTDAQKANVQKPATPASAPAAPAKPTAPKIPPVTAAAKKP